MAAAILAPRPELRVSGGAAQTRIVSGGPFGWTKGEFIATSQITWLPNCRRSTKRACPATSTTPGSGSGRRRARRRPSSKRCTPKCRRRSAMPGGSCSRLWKVSSDGAAAASTTPWSRQSQRFFPREPSEIQYRIRFNKSFALCILFGGRIFVAEALEFSFQLFLGHGFSRSVAPLLSRMAIQSRSSIDRASGPF
jgi:hypothetical protein